MKAHCFAHQSGGADEKYTINLPHNAQLAIHPRLERAQIAKLRQPHHVN